jgi:hypothetical protein
MRGRFDCAWMNPNPISPPQLVMAEMSGSISAMVTMGVMFVIPDAVMSWIMTIRIGAPHSATAGGVMLAVRGEPPEQATAIVMAMATLITRTGVTILGMIWCRRWVIG